MDHNMVLNVLESPKTVPVESEVQVLPITYVYYRFIDNVYLFCTCYIDSEILNAFAPMDLDSVFNHAQASKDVEVNIIYTVVI